MATSFSLSVNRCPTHQDFWSICLDRRDPSGDGSGVRLTHSKCCGHWETIKTFTLTKSDLQVMIEEAGAALDQMENFSNAD